MHHARWPASDGSQRFASRVDREARARRGRQVGIATRYFDRRGLGKIERRLKLIPLGLLIREMDTPFDLHGATHLQFRHDFARGIVAEKPETRSLPFKCTGAIAIKTLPLARKVRRRTRDFRPDKNPALAVADPCDADRRVNRRAHDDALIFLAGLGRGTSS